VQPSISEAPIRKSRGFFFALGVAEFRKRGKIEVAVRRMSEVSLSWC
jgi:hypothetical protein